MAVKLGTIDAGKLRHPAHRQAAAAAHAGAVNHDRVHAGHRFNPVLLGQKADKLHHDEGPDGDDFIILFPALNELFQGVRHKALLAP